jgi:hypothetical protein
MAIAAGSGSMELLEILLSDQRVAVYSQLHGSIAPFIWALYLRFAIERRNDKVSKALLNRKDVNLILYNVREESALYYVLKSGNSKDVGRDQKKVSQL